MRTLLLLLPLAACTTGGTDTSDTSSEAGACVSGQTWTGGNEESPKMNPGEACVACHTDEGEGPIYAIAGTVFTAYDEPDDCNGSDGAIVRITDADGTAFEATANAAGNFFLGAGEGVVMPYTAEVEWPSGTIAAMGAEQSDGDCNTCHSVAGSGGAPGRIAEAAGN